ncbi:flagellar biosynthesis protein FlhF [Bdellovibrio bacteriovorus]|uniref:Flagellar biosynthesis protein FlhF n=1 Tax=Bdellovibrio bacteriovorus str. Tiberius TaxID=1069642 RepID=K7YSR3_BDEBC|nr:flagellar biosynthesis protein FlhF [Bdellovibrio bacteriovorus]AFY02916.1 flagellar biosynthesis protein [Bdellovibrio bacteriovorus str. Tiberius]
MQVKKFEARTMKEALEMVKTQLGPDAIILSARDNNKSFGLVGEGSVEITAAVSEETLQKKKFAESRLREQDRARFQNSTARQQKELIHKMVEKHVQKNTAPTPITQRRYIDIEDESETRVRNAAQRALNAFQEQDEIFSRSGNSAPRKAAAPAPAPVKAAPVARPVVAAESPEVIALKNEIASLKQVITQFQQMPQTFTGSHPGADYGINYDLSFVFEKLTKAGMAPEIAAEILTTAQETLPALKLKNKSLVEAYVARHVLDNTKIAQNPTQGKIHCFVGPAGSGKTSALIKMASQMVVREGKKIALFTTDTFKVGAADQMKIYAQILNVPFSVIRTQNDWTNLMRYLANVDCVLVDYTGLSLKSNDEIHMLKSLLPPAALNPNIHLTLSTNAKDSDATELGRRYSVLGYKDVIFTSLDESTQHGTIYNFMKRFDVPLHSFGIGPRVPEDFEFATKERLLDLIFRITKFKQQDSEAV